MFFKSLLTARPSVVQRGSIASRASSFQDRLLSPSYSEFARETQEVLHPKFGNQRIFRPRDIYNPRDLNDSNFEQFSKKQSKLKNTPVHDILKTFQIDPIREYKNVKMLSHFVNELGHIKPRAQTGLSIVNQMRLAKAIRRARAMGKPCQNGS